MTPTLIINSGPPINQAEIEYTERRLVLGVTADAGEPGALQTSLHALIDSWAPHAVLMAGDNSYGATGPSVDLALFEPFISSKRLWRALGNHDIETVGKINDDAATFPYLPGNRRYYQVTLGGGLLDVFVLHSGRKNDWTMGEADGNDKSSAQYQWFTQAASASQARWKFVMFHHPMVSQVQAEGADQVVEPAMDWGFHLHGIHAVICGHAHTTEIITKDGIPHFNISSAVRDHGTIGALRGATLNTAVELEGDETSRAALRLELTNDYCEYRVISTAAGNELLHSGSLGRQALGSSVAAWTGVGYIWTPSESLAANQRRHVGYLPRNFRADGIRISSLMPQSGSITFQLLKQVGDSFIPLLKNALTLQAPPVDQRSAGVTASWPASALVEAERTLPGGANIVVHITAAAFDYLLPWRSLEVAFTGTWLD